MRLSRLTYFALISILAVSFSCSSPQVLIDNQDHNPVLEFNKKTCKATVIYKDKELSGRVLIKKNGDDTYRVAFYNEMGMTYLEGTLNGKKLEIQNIMPVLDHRLFLKKFRKEIFLLL